nr:palmitoyltransferase ZDHHC16B-like isoform X1 [Pocillopora verrucosa]
MERLKVLLFAWHSLTFNAQISRAVVVDTIFEPVFCLFDFFVRILGPAFLLVVIGLTTSVVVIYYAYLLPVIQEYSTPWVVFHLITAHWLLINIVFHYFKVVFTSPGLAPQETNLEDLKSGKYSLCKKCVRIKPPRSHHCSICKRCVLKMDHHCPWINNCVGHFNHRYFISFCFFMCLGTIYVTVTSSNLFIKHFFHDWNYKLIPSSNVSNGRNVTSLSSKPIFDKLHQKKFNHEADGVSESEHSSVLYVFILCSTVTLALGVLTGWHCHLIGRGETSIEWHSNIEEARTFRKQGLVFRNPYNFGTWNNWRILLGLVEGRSWLRVLLPSVHPPYGDGLTWPPPPESGTRSNVRKLHIV